MAVRWYLMPAAVSPEGHRAPKYFYSRRANPTGDASVQWGGTLYGSEDVYLLWADVTAAQHSTYSADPLVLATPVNIDQALTAGAVTSVSNYLAAIKVPSQWINNTLTYRQVIRGIAELFQVMQVVRGAIGNQTFFQAGLTLGSQWQNVPSNVSTALMDAFTARGYPVEQIQPTTTVRQILRALAARWTGEPIILNGVTI